MRMNDAITIENAVERVLDGDDLAFECRTMLKKRGVQRIARDYAAQDHGKKAGQNVRNFVDVDDGSRSVALPDFTVEGVKEPFGPGRINRPRIQNDDLHARSFLRWS